MPQFTTGSTYPFSASLARDGAGRLVTSGGTPWDLTGATVRLHLTDPDGLTAAYSATVTDADAGEAEYTTTEEDLDGAGLWALTWEVRQSGLVVRTEPETFAVVLAPPSESEEPEEPVEPGVPWELDFSNLEHAAQVAYF